METFGSVLDRSKGFGSGFDFARIALAFGILAFHSVAVTGGLVDLASTPLWVLLDSLVPMFFALSGFLITGSALRLRLKDFLVNRGLRILPALAVEIFVSALILGPIFTSYALTAYFLDPSFFRYFLNIIGLIRYELPGVFLGHPMDGIVNQSLWTVPYEILCYVVMSAIMVLGLLRRPRLLLGLSIAFILMPVSIELAVADISVLPKQLKWLFFGRGTCAFQCFLAGCLAYLYRDRIPMHPRLLLAAVALWLGIALTGSHTWSGSGLLNAALTPALTYAVVYIGLSRIPPVPFYATGDYSYGVYLYGYPLQQAVVALLPGQQSWLLNFALAAAAVTVVAALSWHGIEKPILKLRKKFSFVGRRISEAEARQTAETAPEAAPGHAKG